MRPFLASLVLLVACQTTPPATIAPAVATPADLTPAGAPAATLRGPRWLLHQLDQQPVAVKNPALYLRLDATELQAEGLAGCNRFRGTVEVSAAGALRFGPLMSTRMACPELSVETRFVNALNATRAYRITGDTLHLFGDPTGAPLAKFHQEK